jgi:hypothetical protein
MRGTFGVNTDMRAALFATAILFLTLLASDSALACNCLPLSPSESLKNADVVFEGELIRRTLLPESSGFSLAYTFRVNKSLKGTTDSVVSVFAKGSDCDAYFEPGFMYQVYADEGDGTLTSETCSGNAIVGVIVPRSYSYIQARPYWQPLFAKMVAVCGFGVLLGSGVFVWRRYLTKLP